MAALLKHRADGNGGDGATEEVKLRWGRALVRRKEKDNVMTPGRGGGLAQLFKCKVFTLPNEVRNKIDVMS
jgi:hypothetical protein